MISVRTSVLSQSCLGLAVAAVLCLAPAPAQAQQIVGNGNSRVGVNGENIIFGKLRAPTSRQFGFNSGLSFSTLGLFGDADPFAFNFPSPFIFPLPVTGQFDDEQFIGVSFEDYMLNVAKSFGFDDADQYKDAFLATNNFTLLNRAPLFFSDDALKAQWDSEGDDFRDRTFSQQVIDQFPDLVSLQVNDFKSTRISLFDDEAFKREHEQDFLDGGGFLVFNVIDDGVPPDFVPFDPVGNVFPPILPPAPIDTGDGGDGDTLSQEQIQQIADDAAPNSTEPGITNGVEAVFAAPSSASLALPATHNIVPEPATLGLLALGIAPLLGRSRRR